MNDVAAGKPQRAAEPPSEVASRTTIDSIEMLRGVAAFAVLTFHAQGFFIRDGAISLFSGGAAHLLDAEPVTSVVAHLLFGLGSLGVPLFFIISGFCIHLPYAASHRPLLPAPFARRRFFRLYPPYLAICALGLAMAVARSGWGEEPATWANVLGHLVLWHYSWPIQPGGVEMTTVIWTIVIEVHFYAIYALLLPAIRRVGVARATLFALAFGLAYRIAWAVAVDGDEALRFFEPHRFALARFGEWMLGAWLAELHLGGRLQWSRATGWRRSPLAWTAVSIGGLLVCTAVTAALAGDRTMLDLPATIAFFVLTGGFVSCEAVGRYRPTPRWHAIANWLGSRSYSLYLVHFLMLGAIGEVAARILGVSKDAVGGSGLWLGVTLVGVAAALLAAELVYRFVEAPFHRIARRRGRLG